MQHTTGQSFADEVMSLRIDLKALIESRVEQFRQATGGLAPSSIEVNMVDVRPLGSHRPAFVIGGVRVRIDA